MGVKPISPKVVKASALALVGAALVATTATAQPLPNGGRPGCYAKMAYAATYRTVTEQVQGAPVVTYRDIPAVIEHASKQVLVAPARTDHETIAPIYKTVTRWTEAPGPSRVITTPPVYRTVAERRLISPAHLEWRPGGVAHGFASGGAYGNGDALQARPTGEVLCRVLVPARYALVHRRVEVAPGRQITVPGAPRRVRTEERVLVRPGRVVDHFVAAVYRTVDVPRIARPASRQRIVSPGPVRLISRRVIASPAHYGWAPIVCTPAPHRAPAPMRPRPVPPVYGGQSYGQPAPAPVQGYGGGGSYGEAPAPAHQAFRPDEILAPTPTSFPPLVPAPYDVGHPAKR
jgi:hypothetical protein